MFKKGLMGIGLVAALCSGTAQAQSLPLAGTTCAFDFKFTEARDRMRTFSGTSVFLFEAGDQLHRWRKDGDTTLAQTTGAINVSTLIDLRSAQIQRGNFQYGNKIWQFKAEFGPPSHHTVYMNTSGNALVEAWTDVTNGNLSAIGQPVKAGQIRCSGVTLAKAN